MCCITVSKSILVRLYENTVTIEQLVTPVDRSEFNNRYANIPLVSTNGVPKYYKYTVYTYLPTVVVTWGYFPERHLLI